MVKCGNSALLWRDIKGLSHSFRNSKILRIAVAISVACIGIIFIGQSAALASSASANVGPLPVAVNADGSAWQAFVTNGLRIIANLDGSSNINLSDASPIQNGSFDFKRGPHAGTTVSIASLNGVSTDATGSGATYFTLLNQSEGLVQRLSDCHPSAGPAGTNTNGLCRATNLDLASYSDTSATTVQVTSVAFTSPNPANAPGVTSQSASNVDLANDCPSSDYFPDTIAPTVVSSIYGPLIQYGGYLDCFFQPENLTIIDGLYNYQAGFGYIFTTYWNAAGANNVNEVGDYPSFAPCYSPYSPIHLFATSQLNEVNGVLQPSTGAQAYVNCDQIIYDE